MDEVGRKSNDKIAKSTPTIKLSSFNGNESGTVGSKINNCIWLIMLNAPLGLLTDRTDELVDRATPTPNITLAEVRTPPGGTYSLHLVLSLLKLKSESQTSHSELFSEFHEVQLATVQGETVK